MKTKLSPYTIASNCTDLTDIRDGINDCTPLPVFPDRAIFSERKESHQECNPEQRKIHHRFP